MSLTFLQATADVSDASSYTFANQNLGSAAADRHIIVAVGSRKLGGTATSISSVTVGGVAASVVVSVNHAATNACIAGIAIAAVPTGATGDIVVTFADSMLRCNIGVWRATLANATAHDFDSSIVDPAVGSIDVPGPGFAVGTAFCGNARTYTWTGLTENFDTHVEAAATASGASQEFVSSQTGLAVTADVDSEPAEPVAVFASWGTFPGLYVSVDDDPASPDDNDWVNNAVDVT